MLKNHKWNGRTILAWITIAVILLSFSGGAAVLKYRVNNNEKAIAEIIVKQDEDHDILIDIRAIVRNIEKTINNK